MVNGEIAGLTQAILAGVVVPPEDFLASQLNDRPGPFYHSFESDHGWQGKCLSDGVDETAAVHDQCRLFRQDQVDRPVGGGDINRLKVRV